MFKIYMRYSAEELLSLKISKRLNMNNHLVKPVEHEYKCDLTLSELNVKNQEVHHHIKTFKEELIELFTEHGIKFDEKYLL